jgi:hypothetical protein
VQPNARYGLATVLALALALPCSAGIHYQAVTETEDAAGKTASTIRVEGWVSGESAKVAFVESAGNPITKQGTYLVTKDGGRTLFLVDPEEKTYAAWDLQAMVGMAGALMTGMGPLLKVEFTPPKVEKLAEQDGGAIAGLPTRHSRFRTSYGMTVKVLGMGNSSDVVSEQDIWATDRLQDIGLGVWLRADPPRTGNADLDRLIAAEATKVQGFPLKMVTVNTSTAKKGNKTTTTRSTMEVTRLDTQAEVPTAAFEIPAGYEQIEMLPVGAQ